MAKPLLAEELWERIEPLLPPERAKPKGGRPPDIQPGSADNGILFRAADRLPLGVFSPGTGCGSGMTCWRRLRDWQVAGCGKKIWRVLLTNWG